MGQLRRGARQTLDYLDADLDAIHDHAQDNPAAVRKLVGKIRDRLREEIEPMLQRAGSEPSLEARVQALEEKLHQLQQRNVTPFRKAGNE